MSPKAGLGLDPVPVIAKAARRDVALVRDDRDRLRRGIEHCVIRQSG